jgi:uncharacterized protein YkwD
MKGIPQMKFRSLGVLALTCLFAILVSLNQSHTFSQTKKAPTPTLSQSEQDLLNEINQARANPQAYAGYLEKLKPFFKGKAYDPNGQGALETQEGWSAVEDAIKFMRAAKPLGPLSASEGLSLAALSHVKDQSSSGATGHKGADSTFIEERVKPYGIWQGGIGENLTYGDESARERILTWLIDDGFASRGHRNRLMSQNYRVAGVSCGPHPEYKTMCVLTLAGGFVDKAPGQPSATKSGGATTNTSNLTRTTNSNAAKAATTSNTNKAGNAGKPRR